MKYLALGNIFRSVWRARIKKKYRVCALGPTASTLFRAPLLDILTAGYQRVIKTLRP